MAILVPGNSASILACRRGRILMGSLSTALVIQEFSINVGSHKLRELCTIARTWASVRLALVRFVTRVLPSVASEYQWKSYTSTTGFPQASEAALIAGRYLSGNHFVPARVAVSSRCQS